MAYQERKSVCQWHPGTTDPVDHGIYGETMLCISGDDPRLPEDLKAAVLRRRELEAHRKEPLTARTSLQEPIKPTSPLQSIAAKYNIPVGLREMFISDVLALQKNITDS